MEYGAGVEGCTGRGSGVYQKVVCVFWKCLVMLRHHACKAQVGGLSRGGEQSKMV